MVIKYSYISLTLSTACSDGDILLYNGTNLSTDHSSGTVLVCFNNVYGTVCDDFWDALDASVVCSQLGFDSTGKHIKHVLLLMYM